MLETFLAFKRPQWVGDFSGAMRNSTQFLKEAGYRGDADALRLRLTCYTNSFSHSDTPVTDITISPDEVKSSIESVFSFMDQIDHEHFVGLCGAVGVASITLLPRADQSTNESIIKVEEV